jgi:hypothetical protein
MGGCTSATKSSVKIKGEEQQPKIARSSARSGVNRMRTLTMKDIKGFKRSDSIQNFYDI